MNEKVLNRDFNKIFKINRIFRNPVNLKNLIKIPVQDKTTTIRP